MFAGLGEQLLELLIPSVCPGCDAPRPEGGSRLCGRCARDLRVLPELRGAVTVFAYEGSAERLIHRHKFERRRDATAVLLGPLALRIRSLPAGGLIPVPRHRQRVREQGCDPVHALARALAVRSGRALWDRVLFRPRPVPPQAQLGWAERRRNAAGSFAARAGALAGRDALLLDDVTTTGATLREAARTLREVAGARRVLPVALAGVPRPASGESAPGAQDAL